MGRGSRSTAATTHVTARAAITIARPADAEAIRRVQTATWYATYPSGATTVDGLRRRLEGEHGEKIDASTERWRQRIASADADSAVPVARHAGNVVGFTAPAIRDGKRRVGGLYVLPEAQGSGVGGELLRRALCFHGADDVYLHVAAGNDRAAAFYRRFGFVETGNIIRDQGPVDARIDEIEMIRPAAAAGLEPAP